MVRNVIYSIIVLEWINTNRKLLFLYHMRNIVEAILVSNHVLRSSSHELIKEPGPIASDIFKPYEIWNQKNADIFNYGRAGVTYR